MLIEQPYSYHTFLFPFTFDVGPGYSNFKKIEETLDQHWKGFSWEPEQEEILNQYKDPFAMYAEYKYFHESARRTVYNKGDCVLKSYVYQGVLESDQKGTPWRYVIEKNIKNKNVKYTLSIKKISLHIYKTGVAILSLETVNNLDANSQNMEAVLKINEYGRRLFSPYYSPARGCDLTADCIRIEAGDTVVAQFQYSEPFAQGKSLPFDFHAPIITILVGDGFTFCDEPGKISCHAIDDDRMFTICCVEDSEFLQPLTDFQDGDYGWKTECLENNYNQQSKLYEFVFIDGDGITCIDRKMRLELLEKHLYTRWAGYCGPGTIYGITQHSMVMATSYRPLMETFLNHYTKMMMLVLVQRASIIALDLEASMILEALDKGDIPGDKFYQRVMKLQKKYLHFLVQHLSIEPTAQEQGIEMYNMMQESLFIHREHANLEKQLNTLYEMGIVKKNKREDKLNNTRNMILAFFSIAGGLFALAESLFFIQEEWAVLGIKVVGVVVAIILGIKIYKGKYLDDQEDEL